MGQLDQEKFPKLMAYPINPLGQRVRTNNHVERANRRLRFAEKVRYQWRKRRWVVRYVVLLLDVCWRQAAAQDQESESQRPPPQPDPEGKARATDSTQRKGRTIARD